MQETRDIIMKKLLQYYDSKQIIYIDYKVTDQKKVTK